jgi:hypothetical protein
MTDPVIVKAIQLRDQLVSCADELAIQARIGRNSSARELAAMEAQSCRDAAEMLEKLGTEVSRLRLAIGHFRYGRLARGALEAMANNWNGDPRT